MCKWRWCFSHEIPPFFVYMICVIDLEDIIGRDSEVVFLGEIAIRTVVMFVLILTILRLSGRCGVRQLTVFEVAIPAMGCHAYWRGEGSSRQASCRSRPVSYWFSPLVFFISPFLMGPVGCMQVSCRLL